MKDARLEPKEAPADDDDSFPEKPLDGVHSVHIRQRASSPRSSEGVTCRLTSSAFEEHRRSRYKRGAVTDGRLLAWPEETDAKTGGTISLI